MLSRRFFLKLIGAAAITPVLPSAPAEPEIIANAEFGWTWGNVQSSSPTFSELIRKTLQERAPIIRDELSRNNALLVKLTDNKAIKITKISPEEQTKRMVDRYTKLTMEKHKKKYPTAHKYLMNGEYEKQQNIPGYYIEYDEEPGSRKKHSETLEDRWYK